MIATWATNDKFSNKEKYPYFFRVRSPDKFLVKAIMKFISEQGWTYISMIYDDSITGIGAFSQIKKQSKKFGICIVTAHEVSRFGADFEHIAKSLVDNKNARVVIAFGIPTIEIFDAIKRHNYTDYFIWIGCELWGIGSWTTSTDLFQYMNGAFQITSHTVVPQDYKEYIRKHLIPKKNNEMARHFWEYIHNCSLIKSDCDSKMFLSDVLDERGVKLVDAIFTFAHAADALIKDRCPGAKGSKAAQCIEEYDLRYYLKRVYFQGISTNVSFDKNQDFLTAFTLIQMRYNINKKELEYNRIRIYDSLRDQLTMKTNYKMSWEHLNRNAVKHGQQKSQCSEPCETHQYKISKVLSCCWHCERCHDHEIVSKDGQSCIQCKKYFLADPTTNYITCKLKPVISTSLQHPVNILFSTLTFILVLFAIYCVLLFNFLRQKLTTQKYRIPKCTPQMVAIIHGFPHRVFV